MAWLNLDLPLHEELEIEKNVRVILDCDDLDELRKLAASLLRAWAQQSDLTAQLIAQISGCEVILAKAGLLPEPDRNYLEWARSLYPENDGADP